MLRRMPVGDQVVEAILDLVRADPDVSVISVSIGGSRGGPVNSARLYVVLKPLSERTGSADAIIALDRDDIRARLKEITAGHGPDVVLDPVGGALAEPVFRSIAWRGRYLVVGFASGPIPALPLNLPLLKGASIVGVFWGDFARREPQANATMMAELARWYTEGRIKPVIDRTMPMNELKAAYARMGSRAVMGKLVMVN